MAQEPIGIWLTLTKGHVTIIDREDADLAELKWHAVGPSGRVYAVRQVTVGPRGGGAVRQRVVFLHRVLVPGARFEVDHVDGDRLNNRRSNLRAATRSQNQANQKKRSGLTSRFKGVHYSLAHHKWKAKIANKRIGLFAEEADAALAYNLCADEIYGEFAVLNSVEANAHFQPVPKLESTRRGSNKQFCPAGHPYAGDNLYVTPAGYRMCRACARQERERRKTIRIICPSCGVTAQDTARNRRRFERGHSRACSLKMIHSAAEASV